MLARILQQRSYLASFLKKILQVSRKKEKETSDLITRYFLQEKWTNQKSLDRIFQHLAFLTLCARFVQFSARIMQNIARNFQESCKFYLASFFALQVTYSNDKLLTIFQAFGIVECFTEWMKKLEFPKFANSAAYTFFIRQERSLLATDKLPLIASLLLSLTHLWYRGFICKQTSWCGNFNTVTFHLLGKKC